MRYLQIAQKLREQIAIGRVGAGGALPSETDLGRRYHVSRMTVRRALEVLRDEGLINARKGSGWFVAVDPVRQSLGRFPTIEAAVAGSGVSWERRVLEFRFEEADADVADALEIPEGAEVLRVRRLNLAGGEPLAVVTVWFPAALGAALSRADVERATFYDLLPMHGVQLRSAVQTVHRIDRRRRGRRGAGCRARHSPPRVQEGDERHRRSTGDLRRAPLRRPPHGVRGGVPQRQLNGRRRTVRSAPRGWRYIVTTATGSRTALEELAGFLVRASWDDMSDDAREALKNPGAR